MSFPAAVAARAVLLCSRYRGLPVLNSELGLRAPRVHRATDIGAALAGVLTSVERAAFAVDALGNVLAHLLILKICLGCEETRDNVLLDAVDEVDVLVIVSAAVTE